VRTIIAITRCLKIRSCYYFCHFKGVYLGDEIQGILLEHGEFKLEPGEEYLLHIRVKSIKRKYLMGEILKLKNLSEVYLY